MNKDELQLILEEGEGYRIEFKESITSIDKELVAFANSSGGRIFLGITDDKEIKSLNITNKFKSQIQDIANNCQPPISQKLSRNGIIEFCKAEGKIRFDELINLKFDYNTHFDPQKLEYFLKLAGISKVLDASVILTNLGVAERQEGKVIFNNTGILFFSKNLQDIYFHTALTCALYKGTEKVDVLDRRDFNEDLISSIDRAMNFLKQYIPLRYEMTGEPRRKEIPEIPYEALREAIINAVAHRDYFEKGTNIMVEMFDDRIEITNFGGLAKGLKPEDFGKKSVLRNPNIANLLHRAGYIEKMGTGINKMKKLISKAGLPPIKFEFDTFFTATFKRPKIKEAIVIPEIFNIKFDEMLRDEGVNEGVNEGVKVRLRKEIAYLNIHKYIIRTEVEKFFNISTATAERDLIILKKLDLIIFKGAPKTGKYILTDKGKEIIGNIAN